MDKDRFKGYESDVRELVLGFEAMDRKGGDRYYDVDELETIIDFYLDTSDEEMSEKAVKYGERLFPRNNEIRLRRAHLLCFKKRFNDAYKLLKELERMEPDNTDVLYAIGVTLSEMDQPRKAIQYYHKAAEDGYELWAIYGNIADEYSKMDRLDEARNYYRKALRGNPDDEHSLYELANCFMDDGMTDKWIAYFSHFVEEHPYSKAAWFCLGEAYMVEQLYEKAVEAYQYALAIDDSYYYAYLQLSACYYAMEDYPKAVSTLHDSMNCAEDKAYVYFRIADIFKQTGNLVTANTYYYKALEEDQYYADAWYQLALNFSIQRNFDIAIDAAKRALKIDPESPIYLTTLALIYADSGDSESAQRIFDCALPYYSDFEQGWLGYADFLISRQRWHDAIDALNEGAKDCELVPEFNRRLALCYFYSGQRNMLFNAVMACINNDENGGRELLDYAPELQGDIDVMNLIDSERREI